MRLILLPCVWFCYRIFYFAVMFFRSLKVSFISVPLILMLCLWFAVEYFIFDSAVIHLSFCIQVPSCQVVSSVFFFLLTSSRSEFSGSKPVGKLMSSTAMRTWCGARALIRQNTHTDYLSGTQCSYLHNLTELTAYLTLMLSLYTFSTSAGGFSVTPTTSTKHSFYKRHNNPSPSH